MKKLSVIYDVTALCPWNCPICCMGASSDRSCLCNELSLEEKLSVVRQVRELSENDGKVPCQGCPSRRYWRAFTLSMMRFLISRKTNGKISSYVHFDTIHAAWTTLSNRQRG